jgi:membrane protein implicated in regulation of membrane protease activity
VYTLLKLWRGEIGLGQTFWLWNLVTVIIVWLLFIPLALLAAFMKALLPFFVWIALFLIISVFNVVAVWRSARNYRGPSLWRGLAQFSCVAQVFQLLRAVVELATNTGDFANLSSLLQ